MPGDYGVDASPSVDSVGPAQTVCRKDTPRELPAFRRLEQWLRRECGGVPGITETLDGIRDECRVILDAEFDQRSYQDEKRTLEHVAQRVRDNLRRLQAIRPDPTQRPLAGLEALTNLSDLEKVRQNLKEFYEHLEAPDGVTDGEKKGSEDH